jgi:hypothetical protein
MRPRLGPPARRVRDQSGREGAGRGGVRNLEVRASERASQGMAKAWEHRKFREATEPRREEETPRRDAETERQRDGDRTRDPGDERRRLRGRRDPDRL